MSVFISVVSLTVDASFANVGSPVQLTCTVNGTPPLNVCLEDKNMNCLFQSATSKLEGSDSVYRKVFVFKVMRVGVMKLRCSATYSTGHKESSPFVKIVGHG